MTVQKLNEAISLMDDRYLDMVEPYEKEMTRMSDTDKLKPIRKRLAAALIAAVLVALGSSLVAFAADEHFRAAVMTFFTVEVKDGVEQITVVNLPLPPAQETESDPDDAPAVTVSRVLVPNNGYGANGLFYVCADETAYRSGSRYELYDLVGGELVPLQKNVFSTTCRIEGKDYSITLEWAENGASIGIGSVGGPALTDGSATEGVYTVCQTFYQDGPKALLLLDGRPVIADLTNNTASPVKMTGDAPLPGDICKAEISKDGTTLLLQTPDPGKQYYSVSIASGKVCCLNDLCGSELYGCRFATGSQLVGWAVTGGTSKEDSEVYLAQQIAGQEATASPVDCGTISAWILPPVTDAAMPVLAGKPATVYSNPEAAPAGTGWDDAGTYGILCITGRYAVERRDDGTVVVYDLVENSHSEPYQLVLSAENRLEITVSPDGAKLLLAERNREDGMLIRLSVLDMSADRFTSIGRDPSAVGNEHRADWFDENTVLVDNNTYDAAGSNTGESWYYLYRIGA